VLVICSDACSLTIISQDGSKIFSGGLDNAGRMFDVSTGQSSQVAQHDAPIKSVKWVDAPSGILATGSWDKTVKVRFYWFNSSLKKTDILDSIGTCVRRIPWLRSHSQSDATAWTPCIL